ncbi:MAG: hydrogenase expression/formation C-terminal domain-containing protein [Gammaproteobacteria bacterium]
MNAHTSNLDVASTVNGVAVEFLPQGTDGTVPSGNVEPLLHEIVHALEALARDGATAIIDLEAMPLAPGEADRIRAVLGEGEVRCTLSALGESSVAETGIPGVWWIEHHNAEGILMSRFIEVTRIPSILLTAPEDLTEAATVLRARMDEDTG